MILSSWRFHSSGESHHNKLVNYCRNRSIKGKEKRIENSGRRQVPTRWRKLEGDIGTKTSRLLWGLRFWAEEMATVEA